MGIDESVKSLEFLFEPNRYPSLLIEWHLIKTYVKYGKELLAKDNKKVITKLKKSGVMEEVK